MVVYTCKKSGELNYVTPHTYRLGLRPNINQFSILVLVNVFVGALDFTIIVNPFENLLLIVGKVGSVTFFIKMVCILYS